MRVGTALKSLLRLSNTGVLCPPETHARFLRCFHGSCACLAHAEGKQKVVVIAMPKLSPTMTEGSLLGWLKDTGDQVEPYDLLFELETESLTEEAYRVGDFEGADRITQKLCTASVVFMISSWHLLRRSLYCAAQVRWECRSSVLRMHFLLSTWYHLAASPWPSELLLVSCVKMQKILRKLQSIGFLLA